MKRSPALVIFGRLWLFWAVLSIIMAEGATNTWDGGGADDSWSIGENWNPDGVMPVSASNTTVKLDGPNRTSPVQNLAAPFMLNRLEILNGTSAFYLSGSQLQFIADGLTQPKIYSTREATSTIANDIDIPDGTTLYFEMGTYHLNLNGIISGGGSIDKLQNAGGITLNNISNSFSGGLTIRGIDNDWYKVNVNTSNALGAGSVNLYGGTMITNAVNPGGLIFFNTTSHTNQINLFQNSPIFVGLPTGAASVTLDGNLDLNSFTLTLRGGGTGTISGIISEGATNAVTKVDSGTWRLSGENTFTGAVTVSTGMLTINGSVNASINVQDGAIVNGFGTLNWHQGETVDVAGTLDISQLHLNLQVLDSERQEFIIVDYSSGSLVGATFASVAGKPNNCGLIYDSTNKLIVLRSYNKGTVFMIQ
ncbi:MAG: hypothetical protein A2283_03055 [Lentisphaerae bacterium RIFOXYA12_FULL_48_11]|nr:MAG: hypothetical protein A2283_03055 [Lentisphaerae bacterium RIFOXYA12_FULL_48_11]